MPVAVALEGVCRVTYSPEGPEFEEEDDRRYTAVVVHLRSAVPDGDVAWIVQPRGVS